MPPQLTPRDLLLLFDTAFGLGEAYPQAAPINFVLEALSTMAVANAALPLLESILLQCLLTEPGTILRVADALGTARHNGHDVDRGRLTEALSRVIAINAPLDHGSEVAWAIWVAIVWNVPLTPEAVDAVLRIDDPVVALVALHARSRRLIRGRFDTSSWSGELTPDGLRGANWLIAYEAAVRGWLRPSGRDHIAQVPAFNFLRACRVRFYTIPRPLTLDAAGLRRARSKRLAGY
jgi:hypothetical protein